MATQQEVIKSFMASLDTTTLKGSAALDAAIKSSTGSKFSTFQQVKDAMITDCENNSGDDFLKTYCGINLDNDDTGAITGSDAGGANVKTKNSVVPENGELDSSFEDNEFTVNGFTFKLADAPHYTLVDNRNFKYIDYDDDLADSRQKYIWQAFKTWWAGNALDLIAESYGDNFGYAQNSTTVKEIPFGFVNMNNNDLVATSIWPYDNSLKTNNLLSVTVNMKAYDSIIINNKDGKMSDTDKFYLDRTLSHEFTHIVMAANINYFSYLPQFVKEGMAELTHGVDDDRYELIQSLSNNSTALSNALDASNVGTGELNAYAGGYMFFRYLARQTGDLTIENTTDTKVKTFFGNDNIKNFVSKADINSGAGSDTIAVGSDSNNVTIDSGADNDFINNWSNSAKVSTGAGADTIHNASLASNSYISSGADNDSIKNSGNNVTIDGGAGADSLENTGASVLFVYASGDGNDVITGFNATSTLQIGGGTGTYSKETIGSNVIVTVGTGNVTLKNATSLSAVNIDGLNKKVMLTEGNDTYSNSVEGATIAALGGNDTISNTAAQVSISGGNDSDSLYSNASLVTMNGDSGDDTLGLSRYSSKVSLNGGIGNDYFYNHGKNITIIGGTGDDSVYNSSLASAVNINLGDGNDSIYNEGDAATIDGGAGADTLYNDGGESVSINGGADNDYLLNFSNSVTMTGGAGADTLYNDRSESIKIDGGTGNDSIYSFGINTSINGGDDDDSIGNYAKGYSNGELVFDDGGKNVTITGGKGNDSITSTGANVLFVYASGDGNDVITGFNTTSTLQIGDGTAEYSKATDSNDNLIVTVGEGNITLTGAAKLNPLNILGVEKNPLNIVGTDKAETFNNSLASATIQALGGNDTIINSGATVSINGGADVDSINNSGTKVTILGDAGNDKILNSGTYAKINAGTGNDSIKNTAASVSIVGGTGKDSITNTKTKVTINAGDGNDRIVNSAASVSIIAGTGNDLVSIGANAKNNFISYTAGNDTIKGFNATSTLKIGDGSDTYSKDTDANNLILTVGDYAVTIIGAAGLTNPNILGEEIIATVVFTDSEVEKTTLDGQIITADATARTKAIKITGNALDNSILGGGGKDSLYGGNGADYLAGGADNDKLYGQAGNDYLEGGAGNDLLSGYTGNDTLWGGSGNDTLTGGTGKDLFVYSTGNDVISDYAAGDKISLGAEISSTSLNGSDVVFTIGKYKLTVKDATDTDLTMIDASDKEFTTVVSDAVTYDDTAAAKVSLASYVEVGDAAARTAAIKITGNTLDNMILGGDGNDSIEGGDGADYLAGGAGNDKLLGQNGDDTLWGGIGNDTLTGGTGTDTFIYHSGEGKDVITDFGNDDMLQIIGAFSANYDASAKALAFKVGTTANALRLTNFTATMLSINGKDYAISGTKLVK